MQFTLMQVKPLRENDLRIDPAETVLNMDRFPHRTGILADRFESDRTVLIDPVSTFLSDDRDSYQLVFYDYSIFCLLYIRHMLSANLDVITTDNEVSDVHQDFKRNVIYSHSVIAH